MSHHLQRMIELADQVFDVRNDPEQLNVTEEVIGQLKSIHPATLSETIEGDGPVCWILLIPSTLKAMDDFIENRITESELLKSSLNDKKYEAIYLCSALVLPEFRNKGIAFRSAIDSIKSMQEKFKIDYLYSWPFSEEGRRLSEMIGATLNLPVKLRL